MSQHILINTECSKQDVLTAKVGGVLTIAELILNQQSMYSSKHNIITSKTERCVLKAQNRCRVITAVIKHDAYTEKTGMCLFPVQTKW